MLLIGVPMPCFHHLLLIPKLKTPFPPGVALQAGVLSPPEGCAGVDGDGACLGHPRGLVPDLLFQSGCQERSGQGRATPEAGQGMEFLPSALSLIPSTPPSQCPKKRGDPALFHYHAKFISGE